ncbi:DUF3080 family protein [Salinisphaera sp. P385]|uniref:DUF3080 family protein n=1 Tax=Spectribacter acetivorans TaxID=3075603 RepID=A0ABU3B8Y1_9GAMM|nr:DUF3080 family protein [Salinisphaera sp. P385]MDT0618925.1 DUF3080 family protein [Salinisphaera sp. P385]
MPIASVLPTALTPRLYRRPALILIALLTAACGPADPMEDYADRVARVLDQPVTPAAPSLPRYPRPRDRHLPVPPERTGWIGYFQLKRCGLLGLIGQRNSILGRVAPPARRLDYERTLLAGLRACRPDTREAAADPEFAARLDELIATKQAQLPNVIWNATLGADAVADAFSLAAGRLPVTTDVMPGESLAALAKLTRAARTPQPPETLEPAYRVLETRHYGGRLLQSVAAVTATLDAVTTAIEQRQDRRPLCFRGQANRQARIAETVLREFYIAGLQPHMAALSDAGRLWHEALDALFASQSVTVPEAITRYRDRALGESSRVWRHYRRASREHGQAWTELLDSCGLAPERGF